MKRVIFVCTLMFICSVRPTSGVAFAQSGAGKTCPFNITGMWRIEGTTKKAKTTFYVFAPDGDIMIMSHTDSALPREYEVIGGATYGFDSSDAPKRVEFVTPRKIGGLPSGATSLLVVEYGDNSFVTVDSETQAQTRWIRAQTHRYFLTFAARGGPARSAFAMWTTLDGRDTKIEALGLWTENRDGAAPVFGLIPDRLYHEFENEGNKESDVMFRLELTEAEFERSHKVFETWNEYAVTANLPREDPYLNGMEFLKSAAENLNQCAEKLKLDATAGAATAQNPHQQSLEYIRAMRKKNKNLHVTNGIFPADWVPKLFPN
jgi:hypothetical protein